MNEDGGPMGWTVANLVEATGGLLVCGNPGGHVAGVSTDTRLVRPGDCFVALVGDRCDGHDFVPDALARGAAAVVVSRKMRELGASPAGGPAVLEVADTLYALGELARFHRRRHPIPVVGISGSNGKTSTKEMVSGILGQSRSVLKNHGNFNNLIGVPLTLLSLRPDHDVAVVEMGINIPGEMARLVEIAGPTAGLITGIHPAHLEGLHSLERIFREKTKLYEGLGPEDLAVVNLDDEYLSGCLGRIEARTISYSMGSSSAQVKPVGEVLLDAGGSSFVLDIGGERVRVALPILGLHQVQNAMAAAAVAWGMGESPESIARGLSACRPVRQRMQVHRLQDGRIVVDDTYNANPRSMMAALQTVRAAGRSLPVVAVLGEMRELGEESASLHRGVGREVGGLGISRLITLGGMGREILEGAMESGMKGCDCHHAFSHEDAAAWVCEHCPEGAWIVVKGSRGMTMERVVGELLKNE